MDSLSGKTVIITGSSRGIGRAMALRAAVDGANVVVAAKTVRSRDRLPGTIHDVAAEVEAAGGKGLAVRVDVRDADQITGMAEQAVAAFGGIDVLVNNAGAIWPLTVRELPAKRLDLMLAINVRAVVLTAQACLPHLVKSANAHILNLSPPLNLDPRWLAPHAVYTTSKYAMTMLAQGLAAELAPDGVAANALWPATTIATAAIEWLRGESGMRASRRPEIMADAFHWIVTRPAASFTGRAVLDEDVLRDAGVTDFAKYAVDPSTPPAPDLFVGSPWPDA